MYILFVVIICDVVRVFCLCRLHIHTILLGDNCSSY